MTTETKVLAVGTLKQLDVMFSLAELMCRLMERLLEKGRPDGFTAVQALDEIRDSGPDGEELIELAGDLAHVALEYFAEAFNKQALGMAEMGLMPDKDELQ